MKAIPGFPDGYLVDVAQRDGPGDHLHLDIGRDLPQQLGLGGRMHDHAIDKRHRAELEPPQLVGLFAQARIVLHLGLPLHPQEMKIGNVVEDARLGEMLPDHPGIFRGIRIAVQIHQLERYLLLSEDILDREVIGVVQALDAAALKLGRIGIDPGHIVAGDERHLVAQALQRQHVLERGVGSGILVRLRHRIIDEQSPLADVALGFELGQLAVEAMARQGILPALEELAMVDRLEALHAGPGNARSAARAFEMDDLGGGLNNNAMSVLPYAEAQIGIFVIHRQKMFVEFSELGEQTRFDHQRGAGHVIGIPHVAKPGIVGRLAAAPIPPVAKTPDDAAAFLEAAVRKQ